MKSNEFVFDYAHVLYYKCHKINPNRGGSYIGSPDCIKNKAIANPINEKENKRFQYASFVKLYRNQKISTNNIKK